MTSDLEKKRRWFQVHLSTAVVCMFVAAVLIFLAVHILKSLYRIKSAEHLPTAWLHAIWTCMVVGVIIGILAVTTIVCEWLIRRTRKQQEPKS